MTEDAELLQRWAARADEAAFRRLVERYAGLVHGVAVRRTGGQQALAQEIGQNVFTMLARKAAGLKSHPSLPAWLHRAAVLESAHQLRRESAHTRRLARLAEFTPDPDMSPPSEGYRPDASPWLDEALAKLSDTDRALLLQRFYEDRSYREIAESSGKNEAAVRKQLERALARLTPHLQRAGTSATGLILPGAADSLRAALQHSAPAGFASGVGTAALTAAPSLTIFQLLLHSLTFMTYGKSPAIAGAALILLATFGGSYSAAHIYHSHAAARASDSMVTSGSGTAGKSNASPGKAGIKPVPGNPGDSPARARLRAQMTTISKVFKISLPQRSVALDIAAGADGGGVRAIGEFSLEDLDEAWKLLPDFRGRPENFENLAAFLTTLRSTRDSPEEVLRELLTDDFLIKGKPPMGAVLSATSAWFKTDPSAAWDWMRDEIGKVHFPQERRRPFGTEDVAAWMAKDPAAALAALAPLGAEWDKFTQQTLYEALKDDDKRSSVWAELKKADDRTALMLADSHPAVSDWSRDTLLPWLLTRPWNDGTEPARILNSWTWQEGELDEERFGMLCQTVGALPTSAANEAALKAVREVFEGVTPESRPKLLEKLVPDPAHREKLALQLNR